VAAGRDRGWSAVVPAYLTPTQARRVRMRDCRCVTAKIPFFDSRALQTWHVSGWVEGLWNGLELDVQLARHPSIHQSIINHRRKEEKKAVGVRRDAGRQINKYDYGSRAGCGEYSATHDMRFYRQVT
jgi:hypothetical protein